MRPGQRVGAAAGGRELKGPGRELSCARAGRPAPPAFGALRERPALLSPLPLFFFFFFSLLSLPPSLLLSPGAIS